METEANSTKDEQKVLPEDKPISIVDEARAIRDEIVKAKEELKGENDRQERLKSEVLLSGDSGGNQKVETKEETAKEYADRVLANDKTL